MGFSYWARWFFLLTTRASRVRGRKENSGQTQFARSEAAEAHGSTENVLRQAQDERDCPGVASGSQDERDCPGFPKEDATDVGAKRVFVTGGSGFIGSHFLWKLHEHGWRITLLARSPICSGKPGRPPLPPGTTVVAGALRDTGQYFGNLPSHDALVHLAADYRVGLPPTRRARAAMFQTNAADAVALFDAAHQAGIPRLVHVSTTAALGESGDKFADETHRHNGVFRCYYEETKHIAHELLVERQQRGMPINIAILGGVFGPGDRSTLAQTIDAYFRGKIPFQITTTSRFQLCHVAEVCEGILGLLRPGIDRENVLLTGMDVSMPEIFALLASIAGRKPLPVKSAASLRPLAWLMDRLSSLPGVAMAMPLSGEALNVMDGSQYLYRADKARQLLGWTAGEPHAMFIEYLQARAAQAGISC
jgi:dihydroflavonol-4-reductase